MKLRIPVIFTIENSPNSAQVNVLCVLPSKKTVASTDCLTRPHNGGATAILRFYQLFIIVCRLMRQASAGKGVSTVSKHEAQDACLTGAIPFIEHLSGQELYIAEASHGTRDALLEKSRMLPKT
jgi:hypothetical protein